VFSCNVPRVLPRDGRLLPETNYFLDHRILGNHHLSRPAWGGVNDITGFNTLFGNALNASGGVVPGGQWGCLGPSGFTGKRWNVREHRHEREDKCYRAVPVVWSNFSHLVADDWSQHMTIGPLPDYEPGERPHSPEEPTVSSGAGAAEVVGTGSGMTIGAPAFTAPPPFCKSLTASFD
jgi:hypothetical protein